MHTKIILILKTYYGPTIIPRLVYRESLLIALQYVLLVSESIFIIRSIYIDNHHAIHRTILTHD